jgi:hypothetical protein
VLVGHDHIYERFGPQSSTGEPSPTGPRQFVGTGGKSIGWFPRRARNSAKRLREHGVVRLRLLSGSYRWGFYRAGNGRHLDGGSGSCV